jgi:hypothetical protein
MILLQEKKLFLLELSEDLLLTLLLRLNLSWQEQLLMVEFRQHSEEIIKDFPMHGIQLQLKKVFPVFSKVHLLMFLDLSL